MATQEGPILEVQRPSAGERLSDRIMGTMPGPDTMNGVDTLEQEVQGSLLALGAELRADMADAVRREIDNIDVPAMTPGSARPYVYGAVFGALVFAAGALFGGPRRR